MQLGGATNRLVWLGSDRDESHRGGPGIGSGGTNRIAQLMHDVLWTAPKRVHLGRLYPKWHRQSELPVNELTVYKSSSSLSQQQIKHSSDPSDEGRGISSTLIQRHEAHRSQGQEARTCLNGIPVVDGKSLRNADPLHELRGLYAKKATATGYFTAVGAWDWLICHGTFINPNNICTACRKVRNFRENISRELERRHFTLVRPCFDTSLGPKMWWTVLQGQRRNILGNILTFIPTSGLDELDVQLSHAEARGVTEPLFSTEELPEKLAEAREEEEVAFREDVHRRCRRLPRSLLSMPRRSSVSWMQSGATRGRDQPRVWEHA